MNLNKIKINNNVYRLYFKKGVFEPTATTNFLINSFIKRNKKISNKKILDLGCGSGIVSIIINDKLENNIFYASDLSKNSIVCCDKNFKKFKIKGIIKSGSLFKPWTDKKFDFIINDISGISSILSKKSNWFKNVPADTGEDGTKLTIQVIKDSKKRLTKNGKLYLPLISLCNNDKVIKIAKLFFKNIKITSENRWFLPKELEKNKKLLEKLKKQNKISFEYKFGKFICSTRILELKN
mgnify:FL=1